MPFFKGALFVKINLERGVEYRFLYLSSTSSLQIQYVNKILSFNSVILLIKFEERKVKAGRGGKRKGKNLILTLNKSVHLSVSRES